MLSKTKCRFEMKTLLPHKTPQNHIRGEVYIFMLYLQQFQIVKLREIYGGHI